jgi:hypothetical protein
MNTDTQRQTSRQCEENTRLHAAVNANEVLSVQCSMVLIHNNEFDSIYTHFNEFHILANSLLQENFGVCSVHLNSTSLHSMDFQMKVFHISKILEKYDGTSTQNIKGNILKNKQTL